MAGYTTADIRNIALVGHSGGGKTTLAERLLHDAGVIGRIGTVQDGNTVCDYEEDEKEFGRSLSSAIVHFNHLDRQFNLIDTPGSPDFLGHAIPCLPAVETLALVVDAGKGVQTVTRRMMNLGAERRLPRVIIINKIDHHLGDAEALVESLQETFGKECLPANLPNAAGDGVIDVLGDDSGDPAFSSVESAHTAIVDQCVEVDEDLMAKYLEAGSVSKEDLHNAFEKSLREGHLVPILFCSATTGAGIEALLKFFADWAPSPLEGNPRPFELTEGEGEEPTPWYAEPDPSKSVVAHVFKVASDPFVGKLAVFRIHQGSIKTNESIHRNDEKKPVRLGHLLLLRGKEHTEVSDAIPGDIIAVAKVEELKLNDVLHADAKIHGLHLRPLPLPKPMLGLAIEPKSRGDETKLGSAIHKLQDEDPTFHVERIAATKQTVARGLGDLHLRVLISRLKDRFSVEVTTAQPKVAYKETISAKAEGHHRHKKQTGGAGQFGEVFLRVEPLNGDNEEAFEFVDDTFGGSVPRQFLPAIEKGVRSVLANGAIAGYPMTGVRVAVYDGKHHPVDSKEIAFVTAGKKAFIDAVQKAKPVLLEPFVDIEVTAPSQYMGDLTSDLISKRGRINGSDILPGDMCSIHATAPLSELMTYTSQLKSITGGAGAFSMDYSHDEATPSNIQAEVIAAFKPHEDED